MRHWTKWKRARKWEQQLHSYKLGACQEHRKMLEHRDLIPLFCTGDVIYNTLTRSSSLPPSPLLVFPPLNILCLFWGMQCELCNRVSSGGHHCYIIMGCTGSSSHDALKDIIDEQVEDGCHLVGDTCVRVHLLKHCKAKWALHVPEAHAERIMYPYRYMRSKSSLQLSL